MIEIALYQPEIPPNTGNIIRLCANMGSQLQLIHPIGFDLDHKTCRRPSLDYRSLIPIHEHANYTDFRHANRGRRIIACSTKATTRYCDYRYSSEDILLFGPETRGLPDAILSDVTLQACVTIPMHKNSRSLNLANACAIIAFEAWQQLGFMGSDHA